MPLLTARCCSDRRTSWPGNVRSPSRPWLPDPPKSQDHQQRRQHDQHHERPGPEPDVKTSTSGWLGFVAHGLGGLKILEPHPEPEPNHHRRSTTGGLTCKNHWNHWTPHDGRSQLALEVIGVLLPHGHIYLQTCGSLWILWF